MELLNGIASNAPVWVWPLGLLLLLTGLRATKQRQVPVFIIYALPLLGILSFNAVSDLAVPAIAWPAFAIAYALGGWTGWRLQGRWLLGRDGELLTVAGEWLTLATMMLIYLLGFVRGVTEAVNPDLWASAGFVAGVAALSGLAAGTFLGRAMRTLRG